MALSNQRYYGIIGLGISYFYLLVVHDLIFKRERKKKKEE